MIIIFFSDFKISGLLLATFVILAHDQHYLQPAKVKIDRFVYTFCIYFCLPNFSLIRKI